MAPTVSVSHSIDELTTVSERRGRRMWRANTPTRAVSSHSPAGLAKVTGYLAQPAAPARPPGSSRRARSRDHPGLAQRTEQDRTELTVGPDQGVAGTEGGHPGGHEVEPGVAPGGVAFDGLFGQRQR